MHESTCIYVPCGNPLGTSDRRKKYCSQACREAETRRRARVRYEAQRGTPELTARMQRAARRYYEKSKADPELLARRRAATASWRERNRDAMSERYREWRIENADRVRAKNHRRRAMLLDAFVEDVDPAEVFERDGGICGLCGDPVDLGIPWPHKMSKTLDHITPLIKGGTHELANVQLAHAVCNSRKNDRAS